MYVLVIQGEGPWRGRYLYSTRGEWGPRHLSTEALLEADLFETAEAAKRCTEESSWYCIPAAVKVTVTLIAPGRTRP
jgi:hypothetical protein